MKSLSLYNNDNFVKYVEDYKEDGHLNIIMEYGGDMNLDNFIKEIKNKGDESIEEEIIKKIVLQICNGLQEIHEANIVHRDLTPANIFINTNNYSIKIGDFGISTKLETNQSLTYSMKGRGNYEYTPPEIIEGNKTEITKKVDIYSLGCIIYELFTRKKYQDDKKIDTDLYNEEWQNLIEDLLKKESSKRPDIGKVIEVIKNIQT